MLEIWLEFAAGNYMDVACSFYAWREGQPEGADGELYQLLQAVALTGPLQDNWIHPFGRQVLEEAAPIYSGLAEQVKPQFISALWDKTSSDNARHLEFLAELSGSSNEQVAAAMLLKRLVEAGAGDAAIIPGRFPNPVDTRSGLDIGHELWDADIATLLGDITPLRKDNKDLDLLYKLLQMVEVTPRPEWIPERTEVFWFDYGKYPEYPGPVESALQLLSPSLPILACAETPGSITVFNIESWEEHRVPRDWAVWSPGGKKLAVMSVQGEKLVISFYSTDLNKTREITVTPPFTEIDWLKWPLPGVLEIHRFRKQDALINTEVFAVNIQTGAIENWNYAGAMEPVHGTNLLTNRKGAGVGLGLFDSRGNPVGSKCKRVPQEDSAHVVYKVSGGEVYAEVGRLMYRADNGNPEVIADEGFGMWFYGSWVVEYEGWIYAGSNDAILRYSPAMKITEYMLPEWHVVENKESLLLSVDGKATTAIDTYSEDIRQVRHWYNLDGRLYLVRYPTYYYYYKYNDYEEHYPGVDFSAVPIVITEYRLAGR
jgi:hypothetical protein